MTIRQHDLNLMWEEELDFTYEEGDYMSFVAYAGNFTIYSKNSFMTVEVDGQLSGTFGSIEQIQDAMAMLEKLAMDWVQLQEMLDR